MPHCRDPIDCRYLSSYVSHSQPWNTEFYQVNKNDLHMLLFSHCENIKIVIFTIWKYQKCYFNNVASRNVLHAAPKIWQKHVSKTKENVINRKFNGLMINIEFISLLRRDVSIFSPVLCSRENNKKKILFHSWNKFHIQRQTIWISSLYNKGELHCCCC